jgi:hypothetical protein
MIENLTREQYDTVLRQGFVTFTARCFHDLKGETLLAASCLGSPEGARLAGGSPKAGETDLHSRKGFSCRWDREFESAFLQRRVCEPPVPGEIQVNPAAWARWRRL